MITATNTILYVSLKIDSKIRKVDWIASKPTIRLIIKKPKTETVNLNVHEEFQLWLTLRWRGPILLAKAVYLMLFMAR